MNWAAPDDSYYAMPHNWRHASRPADYYVRSRDANPTPPPWDNYNNNIVWPRSKHYATQKGDSYVLPMNDDYARVNDDFQNNVEWAGKNFFPYANDQLDAGDFQSASWRKPTDSRPGPAQWADLSSDIKWD